MTTIHTLLRSTIGRVQRLTCASLSAVAFAAGAALPASAAVLVDDFSSGPASGLFAASPTDATYYREQLGAMAGGARQWYLLARGPADLGASVDVSSAGFDFHSDLGVGHRFDWSYGGQDHPMNLDFTGENSLRFSFAQAPRGLNFNVLLYYRGQIDNYSQLGVNIGPETAPFNVDFKLSDFAAAIADGTRPADFSQVSGMYIVTQSGGYFAGGGEGFRMTNISAVTAVPEAGTAALMLAGVAGLLMLRKRRVVY
jgi:hypothetical protein